VSGATSTTYVLSTDDSGKAIKVRVTATNAAGSSSADSSSALLRNPLFSDGFESGLAKWANSGLTTTQTNVFAGAWSARALATGTSGAYATATLTSPQTDLTYRLRFRGNTTWPPSGVYLLKMRTAANGAVLGVYVNGSGKLSYKNDTVPTGGSFSTTMSVPLGAWNDLSVHVTIAGASSSIDMTLNGAHATIPARTDNFGTTAIGKVLLGDNSTGRSFDVSADEVVVTGGS
jgi:hypothetical protein